MRGSVTSKPILLIYDSYGAKGLKIAEQVGEEVYKQACIINASFVFTTCIMQYCKMYSKQVCRLPVLQEFSDQPALHEHTPGEVQVPW